MGKVFWLAEGGMNNTQKRILDWLKELEPELGELYEGAVHLISERGFPGRGRFICHAVREIRNRLPDTVAGKGEAKRLEYTEEVTLIARAWEKAGLEGAYEKQSGKTRGEPEECVPREVLVSVDRLVRKHKEVGGRKERNARRLLIALEPENKRLQESLGPVVKRWLEETEWFVERSHIRRTIDEGDLIEHFEIFENVLASLVGFFYEGFDRINQIVRDANTSGSKPSDGEVREAIWLLWRARYRMHFFGELENPHWIKPLKDAGFFKIPPDAEEGEAYERWPEGCYLKKMSAKVPEDVLGVIEGIVSRNPFVRMACLECLLAMPEDVAAKGVKLVENLLQRRVEEGDWGWFWGGREAAELMVKLSRSRTREAFKIAWVLVDAWETGKERAIRDMTAKFGEYHYEELIFKYYNKLFEIDAERATGILVKILERYVRQVSERDGFDVSSHYYISIENLEEIDRRYAGVLAVLVKGICAGGRAVIEKQPEKIKQLLDYLDGLDKAIFYRIEMYLLRFVPERVETERINRIVGNKKFLEEPGYKYEYKLLLRGKFEEVPETRKVFEKWVDGRRVDDVDNWKEWFKKFRDKEPTKEDLDKYEVGMKAKELFLVKDKYKELYEKYKKVSGLNDAELAPRRMVGEVRHVSPMEGTPLQPEEMAKKKVDEVLDYISEPKNYEGKAKPGDWSSPTEALRATFKEDVKKRVAEYLKCDVKKLGKLPAGFLGSLFYGIQDAVRDGSFSKSGWENVLEVAHTVVKAMHKDEAYRNCFSAMLSTLRDGLSDRENKIEFDEQRVRKFWEIIEPLVHFPIGDRSGLGEERDPVQLSCNIVAGQAMELTVPLSVVCKRDFEDLCEKYLKGERRKCYEYVLSEIRQPGVNCMFGLNFARICWLDNEWVDKNIERIFCNELWDEIWGTYVSWGRPSPQGFKLLIERGEYCRAVELLGSGYKYKYEFQKKPDEGLVEHLMIGFFNGWIGFEDAVLQQFFENAPGELRGEAARFLTTGFKSVNEEGGEDEKKKVAGRMREYWNKRLAAIKDTPEENKDEAVELTGWVEDSALPAKETLELLEQSLDLSGGKIGKMRDARDFVEGVSKLGKGNELLALRCLKKAAADENMHMSWSRIQEPLVSFLETIVDLPEDVRSTGREVADTYGRYNPDKFRAIWERLRI